MSRYVPVSQRGSSSPSGTITSLDDFMRRLSNRESSGSYTVKGIPTKYGRALGKYQVMEAFLPDWSTQYLGRAVTPDEFLGSPDLQERLARARISELYKKHGNWDDVASIWHSGRPLAEARAAGAKDGLGTTTASYVSDITGGGSRSLARGQSTSLYTPLSMRRGTMEPTA